MYQKIVSAVITMQCATAVFSPSITLEICVKTTEYVKLIVE